MKQDTLDYISDYAAGRSSKDAADSLSYLCSMLWLCRSDKLYGPDIPFLVDITNSVTQASDQFSHLPVLPDEASAFKLNRSDTHFKDASHHALRREVRIALEALLQEPPEEEIGMLQKIKNHLLKQ